MPRPKYVWLVQGVIGGRRPIAAFTVKRELIKWLTERRDKHRGRSAIATNIWRLGDGGIASEPKMYFEVDLVGV